MKKNIAIIMGGYSSEYLISLKSGGVVYDSLPKISYNAYCIHIFKDKWVYVAEDLTERPVDKADFSINVAGSKIILTAYLMPFTAVQAKTDLCKPILNYYLFRIPVVVCTKRP